MHELIEAHRDELRELCRRHHVRRLELFGSAASGAFDPERSDVDLLVEFTADVRRGFRGDYFGLKQELEMLFGRPVDLVEVQAVDNPFFLRSIQDTRTELYAA